MLVHCCHLPWIIFHGRDPERSWHFFNVSFSMKLQRLLTDIYLSIRHSTALYFRISIWIFCTQFICLVFDGLLQWICFRMFCSKHSITLENTYLISCWFHCVDKLCIKFRFCEIFTVINFVTRTLLIQTLTLELLSKSCFTLYLHMYYVLCINMYYVCFRFV